MYVVKSRKVGNSVALSVPKQFGLEVGKEFVVYKSRNDVFIFSPKISNPFLSEVPFEKDEHDEDWQDQAQEELSRHV